MIGSPLKNIAGFIAGHPLTRDQKLTAFWRFFRWQIQSRIQNEVIVPWIGGVSLAVRRGMTGATGNIYCGLHEFEDMAFVLHFLRPDDVFVDIGANIGSYTMIASGVSGARSMAFEPDPGTFAALSRNIALNRLGALVESRNAAVGAAIGQAQFTMGLDTVNRVTAGGSDPSRTVPMETLDHALSGRTPSLIKLDVEGYESEVLRGAAQTLNCDKLKAIITEDRSPAVTDIMRDGGFAEYSYDPFSRSLGPKTAARNQNGLFIRDKDFVQQRLRDARRVRVLGRSI